jgi:urease accessory protein
LHKHALQFAQCMVKHHIGAINIASSCRSFLNHHHIGSKPMQTTQIRRTILATGGVACALVSPLAMAHLGADLPHSHDGNVLSSFMNGALHPLTGMDHLAAMLSVGMWSALSQAGHRAQGDRRASMLAAPLAFAGTLLIGAVMGMAGLALPGVEPMLAASLLVMGLLVATRLKLQTGFGAVLVAVFALFHGLAHGQELGGHAIAALSGMVLSTAMLHGVGMGLGLTLRDQNQTAKRWLTRAAGAGLALLGLSLLTPAVATVI